MAKVVVNGNELDYVDVGSGPAVVLVHGFGSGRGAWEQVVEDLRDEFRVIAYSHRGFPPSQAPAGPDPFSLQQLVDDLLVLLDELGAEKPHLVGSSMGAGVVRRLLLRHPERVRSAVLDGGHGGGATPQPAHSDGPSVDAICQAAKRDMHALAERWCSAPHFGSLRRKTPRRWEQARDRFAAIPVSTVVACQRGIRANADAAWASADELAATATPTLVLFGDEDGPAIAPSFFNVAAIPNAGLAVLPGCGHFAHVEEPQMYATVLRSFFAAVDGGTWQPLRAPALTSLAAAG